MTTTTVSVTLDVLREWFLVHGIPEQLVTDNGSQFTADAFKPKETIYDTFVVRLTIRRRTDWPSILYSL